MKKWSRFFNTLIIIAVIVSSNEKRVHGEPITTYIYLPIITKDYAPPVYLRTNIDNIDIFLENCPNNDPIYSKLRSDFTIRIDGVIVGDILCTEPVSTMPLEQVTSALIAIQAFRTIYYMDPGVSNFLPWTSMNLYDWMAANIGGINFKTAPGAQYCCDTFDGKKYIAQTLFDDLNLDMKRKWRSLEGTIAFFAHETRHADGGPGHVTGCAAYPNPTDPLGCDTEYNLSNLGSYGVQYWLHKNFMTGYLDIGLSCASDGGLVSAQQLLLVANNLRSRFIYGIPPIMVLPNPPYGGPCYAP